MKLKGKCHRGRRSCDGCPISVRIDEGEPQCGDFVRIDAAIGQLNVLKRIEKRLVKLEEKLDSQERRRQSVENAALHQQEEILNYLPVRPGIRKLQQQG